MQKLIELLNEYEKELNTGLHWRIDEMYGMLWRGLNLMGVDQYLISKHYGFIKRLVENDKIDFYTILKENGTFRKEFYAIENKKEYERLIMLLSVEDEPIEFLVSILK